jgi:pimeloyl-ACP methyl ester carboxylesterase
MENRRRTLGLDVPEVRTVVIADAGHWVHHDQPMAFLRAIDSFFQED